MPRLGVNIDHVATLRQARGGREPDPVWAAVAGRAGRRRRDHGPPPRGPPAHPGPRPAALRETVQVRLNLELAVEPAIVAIWPWRSGPTR